MSCLFALLCSTKLDRTVSSLQTSSNEAFKTKYAAILGGYIFYSKLSSNLNM